MMIIFSELGTHGVYVWHEHEALEKSMQDGEKILGSRSVNYAQRVEPFQRMTIGVDRNMLHAMF